MQTRGQGRVEGGPENIVNDAKVAKEKKHSQIDIEYGVWKVRGVCEECPFSTRETGLGGANHEELWLKKSIFPSALTMKGGRVKIM